MPDHREMSEHSPAMVWRAGTDQVIDWANKSWLDFTGYSLSEAAGRTWSHVIHEDDATSSEAAYRAAFAQRAPFTVTYRIRRFDGEFRWVVDHAAPFIRGGEFAGYFGSVTDITEEHDTHEAVLNALQQRDVFLGEIYHRVKNNLQQIEGLIALESLRITDVTAQNAMHSISARVRAMAAVHKHLMTADGLKQIRTDVFLSELVADLARAHGADRKSIYMDTSIEHALLNIDKAMTLGLIINELITNVFKYAFPDSRSGTVRVRYGILKGAAANFLEVADDGVGILEQGSPSDAAGGSGMRLVQGFAEQLGGTVSVSGEKGTIVRVEFP